MCNRHNLLWTSDPPHPYHCFWSLRFRLNLEILTPHLPDYTYNVDVYLGSDITVRAYIKAVNIATLINTRIFHTDHITVLFFGGYFIHFVFNELAACDLHFPDSKRILFSGDNLHFGKKRLACGPRQYNAFRSNLYKFFHHSGNSHSQPRPIRIIGLDAHTFPNFPAPITGCVEFDLDMPLLPGKDLPRAAHGSTSSAGLDLEDLQKRIPLV